MKGKNINVPRKCVIIVAQWYLIYKSKHGVCLFVCLCICLWWMNERTNDFFGWFSSHTPAHWTCWRRLEQFVLALRAMEGTFLTVSVFGHPEFACITGVHQNLDMEFLRTWFSGREISVLGRTRCGFPRPKPGNFLDMIFKTWDLQFLETWSLHSGFPRPKKTWEILGYGFQDLGSQLWGLDFHTRGFQDRNLKTFRTWFQDVGSQFWDLDFTQGLHMIQDLEFFWHMIFKTWMGNQATSQCPKVTGTH